MTYLLANAGYVSSSVIVQNDLELDILESVIVTTMGL